MRRNGSTAQPTSNRRWRDIRKMKMQLQERKRRNRKHSRQLSPVPLQVGPETEQVPELNSVFGRGRGGRPRL